MAYDLPSENLEKVKPSRPEVPWRLVIFIHQCIL